MSLTLTELVDSRESVQEKAADGSMRTTQVVLKYVLEGTSDDETARSVLESSTAAAYGELVRSQIDLSPDWADTVSGDGIWPAEVRYVLPDEDEPETGESSYTFQVGAGSRHITQSLNTVGKFAPGGDPPNFNGIIGVAGEGADMKAEGVDIDEPSYHWSETHYLPDSQITLPYRGRLRELASKTNDAPFKGCKAGECRFLGASGAKRGAGDWEITFNFAANPNSTDIRTPELIALGFVEPIPKKGWQYVWFRHRWDEVAEVLVLKVEAIYVERVYEADDFADLGIGA